MILRYLRRNDFRGRLSIEATGSGAGGAGGSGVSVVDMVFGLVGNCNCSDLFVERFDCRALVE